MDGNISYALKEMENALLELWGEIKRIAKEVTDIILERNKYEKHHYDWHVPLDTTRNSQVIIKPLRIPNIRNHI